MTAGTDYWKPQRERLGVVLLDMPRYIRSFFARRWIFARNRNDILRKSPDSSGVRVDARWSSELHACGVFPLIGRVVQRRAFKQWPVRLCENGFAEDKPPVLSFIIPHRGRARLPLLRLVVESIAGQSDVPIECIVVEQSPISELEPGDLPPGTTVLHRPHPDDPDGWHFSWAFNEGARAARADILVFHDGDILAPCDYASEIIRKFEAGWSGGYLQRFLFCLDRCDTDAMVQTRQRPARSVPERIRQNWCGGTRAVRRGTFLAVGGFEERFVGWGGEDNEFSDRMEALHTWRFGYVPFIHLWHPPQAAKIGEGRWQNLEQLDACLAEPRERRIRKLHARLAARWSVEQPIEDMVSTVIPCYNRSEYLTAAVESVLQQMHRPIEVILSNDGSDDPAMKDEMARLANAHPDLIRTVHNPHRGPGPAREAGRQVARGEFIQYLDSDDRLLPDKFKLQVKALRENPEASIAYGVTRLIDHEGRVLKEAFKWTGQDKKTLFPDLLVDRWWCTHTPLYRRTLTDAVGPWSDLPYSQDWEYDARAGALGSQLAYVNQPVSQHRQHHQTRQTGHGKWLSSDDQVRFFTTLLECALQAGVRHPTPELGHFARWVFSASRQSARAGDVNSARALLHLARQADPTARDLILYEGFTQFFGAKATACMAQSLERFTGRSRRSKTMQQSWMESTS